MGWRLTGSARDADLRGEYAGQEHAAGQHPQARVVTAGDGLKITEKPGSRESAQVAEADYSDGGGRGGFSENRAGQSEERGKVGLKGKARHAEHREGEPHVAAGENRQPQGDSGGEDGNGGVPAQLAGAVRPHAV